MKLLTHFDAFLKNKVNLRDTRIDQLDSRVEAIHTFLSSGEDVIAENFIDLIPQRSYVQLTIINPVGPNAAFAPDVLLDMDAVDVRDADAYVDELYTVFPYRPVSRD